MKLKNLDNTPWVSPDDFMEILCGVDPRKVVYMQIIVNVPFSLL